MSEKLSPEDNSKAHDLYITHELVAKHYPWDISRAENISRTIAPLIPRYDPEKRYEVTINDLDEPDGFAGAHTVYPDSELKEKRRKNEAERKANLWDAREHKEAHLDEYIETARQEAEAQGVHINLEQPVDVGQEVEVHTPEK